MHNENKKINTISLGMEAAVKTKHFIFEEIYTYMVHDTKSSKVDYGKF